MTIEHVSRMRDHWWWRPGWRVGRHFYACHFTLADHPALVDLVARYQSALSGVPGLDLIPAQWLHLTTQGIGFVDEVSDVQLRDLRLHLDACLAELPAPTVTFHRPVVRPEAVYLPAEPAAPVAAVRSALRRAVAEVLGAGRVEADPVQGFRPHVSVAYSNGERPAEPIVAALAEVDADPVAVTLSRIDILAFHRDNRMYEWTSAEGTPIGHGSRHGRQA
ncbi:2'-5' RNA ligase family protein [Micromonospora fluostatini]|uniref:2'-5' RNA ligase family protein n=1 Tax=Micromonospora fluostatini TaxID=1629071 RepID=A0ABY2DFH3_9ACTN|nr:2'-5' RNA ligase family protein [Micromonospora fluostatini]